MDLVMLILAAVVVALVAFVMTRSNTFRVTRRTKIRASCETVRALVDDFRNWAQWSPWEKLDPDMEKTFEGPAEGEGAIILCGRFEGFDERIFETRPVEPISIGDYVLSGGELGAMVLLDACVRLLPGIMGAASSGEEESFETGLLEYPHYTRPVDWEGRTIPEVLRSGDHARIAAWRREQAILDTRSRRPDLMERHGDATRSSPSGARHED